MSLATPDTEPCDLLTWDSDFWGFRMAQVRGSTLRVEDLVLIDTWCRARAVRCLSFLASFDDPLTILAATAGGFHLVDARMTLGRPSARNVSPAFLPPDQPTLLVRPAIGTDLEALQQIAAMSHRDSRFYFDQRFPRAGCDELYARWIRESYHGFADAVLVAQAEAGPVGYITGHLPDAPGMPGRIGLLGVAAAARGQGAARLLVRRLMDWFADHEVDRVSVVTQGRNIPAQGLYQACGFRSLSFALWYHCWTDRRIEDQE